MINVDAYKILWPKRKVQLVEKKDFDAAVEESGKNVIIADAIHSSVRGGYIALVGDPLVIRKYTVKFSTVSPFSANPGGFRDPDFKSEGPFGTVFALFKTVDEFVIAYDNLYYIIYYGAKMVDAGPLIRKMDFSTIAMDAEDELRYLAGVPTGQTGKVPVGIWGHIVGCDMYLGYGPFLGKLYHLCGKIGNTLSVSCLFSLSSYSSHSPVSPWDFRMISSDVVNIPGSLPSGI